MRRTVLALVLAVGCGDDRKHVRFDAAPDTPKPPDANLVFCPAPTGTANVTKTANATTTTYSQLHAGGIWFTGPVAPVAGPDMSASLLLTTSTAPVPSQTAFCCSAGDSSCCALEGIVVDTDGLGVGQEIGSHPVRIHGFESSSQLLTGTLTITAFEQPFERPPGRIAGSISASGNGITITGTYDNQFCDLLLGATI